MTMDDGFLQVSLLVKSDTCNNISGSGQDVIISEPAGIPGPSRFYRVVLLP
jgi:hypothetical protein